MNMAGEPVSRKPEDAEGLSLGTFLGPAQNALFDLNLIKIFAMRFVKPGPGLHRGFHVFADGT